MDEEILKTMPEYVQNLPKPVQDFIFNSAWESRTSEIAQKYSLNETQTDDLINNVLFVLIGLEKPEDFLETIIAELSISRLLGEQIMEDLEVRVFEYAVKSMEKKMSNSENSSQQPVASDKEEEEIMPEPPVSRVSLDNEGKTSKIPEIKPEILPEERPEITPIVEEGEVAHDTKHDIKPEEILPKRGFGKKEVVVEPPVPEPPVPEPTPSTSKLLISRPLTQNPIPRAPFEQEENRNSNEETKTEPLVSRVSLDSMTTPRQPLGELGEEIPKPEPIQKPVPQPSVPRFDAGAEEKPPQPIPEPPKKYAVDPYREPIE